MREWTKVVIEFGKVDKEAQIVLPKWKPGRLPEDKTTLKIPDIDAAPDGSNRSSSNNSVRVPRLGV